ncbi:MAG: tRNA-intron lyase [Candidatus Kariarchaeaceae archaeon]|jgi:tRNA-intron endonuclease
MSGSEIPIASLDKDTAVIWDYSTGSMLYTNGFYGKPMGLRKADPGMIRRPFVLSLFETLYLLENGIIGVQEKETEILPSDLQAHASSYYEDFQSKYHIYKHLRDLGYIVRPGMKFGSDFVIYQKGPGIDHSQWVVHVEEDETELKAIEIVRAGRLAASVKKRYLIATQDQDKKPVFYSFDRVKI